LATISQAQSAPNENNGDEVVVFVKDTGSGIDPDFLQRLFTKITYRSQTCTSFGFISMSIVEALGGKIEGRNYNNGESDATFTFILALAHSPTMVMDDSLPSSPYFFFIFFRVVPAFSLSGFYCEDFASFQHI
jgi:K+-sensing histidine kinase KdpD